MDNNLPALLPNATPLVAIVHSKKNIVSHPKLGEHSQATADQWQRRIFTTVFNRSFNCLPDGQKDFQFT
jgi:hypothetical protein